MLVSVLGGRLPPELHVLIPLVSRWRRPHRGAVASRHPSRPDLSPGAAPGAAFRGGRLPRQRGGGNLLPRRINGPNDPHFVDAAVGAPAAHAQSAWVKLCEKAEQLDCPRRTLRIDAGDASVLSLL